MLEHKDTIKLHGANIISKEVWKGSVQRYVQWLHGPHGWLQAMSIESQRCRKRKLLAQID